MQIFSNDLSPWKLGKSKHQVADFRFTAPVEGTCYAPELARAVSQPVSAIARTFFAINFRNPLKTDKAVWRKWNCGFILRYFEEFLFSKRANCQKWKLIEPRPAKIPFLPFKNLFRTCHINLVGKRRPFDSDLQHFVRQARKIHFYGRWWRIN